MAELLTLPSLERKMAAESTTSADLGRKGKRQKREERRSTTEAEVQANADRHGGPKGASCLCPARIGIPVSCRKRQLADRGAACVCPRRECGNYTAPLPGDWPFAFCPSLLTPGFATAHTGGPLPRAPEGDGSDGSSGSNGSGACSNGSDGSNGNYDYNDQRAPAKEHPDAEDFVEREFEFGDSDDDSEWRCVGVSNHLDNDGQFSVACKPIKPGRPGAKSKTGIRRQTNFSVRYLQTKL